MWLEVLIIIFTILLLWLSLRKPSEYPPGPWGFPLIGWPPLGLEDFLNKLAKWKKENHDIIGWRIGTKFMVCVLDYEMYKEVYQHPNIAFRPQQNALTYMKGEKLLGIVISRGAHWSHIRRFTLKHLRDFGMGKEKFLLDSHFEAEKFIGDLKERVGQPTTIPSSLLISVLNTVWQMVGSVRYDFNDEEIKEFISLAHQIHVSGPKLIILDVFPWLKRFPNFLLDFLFKRHVQNELSEKIKAYFIKHVHNHMKDLNEAIVRDYIDAYLLEMERQKSDPNSTMSVEDLLFCLSDLFEGGVDTTALTIHWAILYLARNKNVQENLQKEVDEVLPKGTQFEMKDKTRLPYTEAFISEILRLSSVIVTPPRAAIEDTKIGPYIIPKGAWVLGENLLMHYDPKYWHSPEEIRPERFLDSNGKFAAPSTGFVPFGYGRRVCIGEMMARMQLFVFITKLVQNFTFSNPAGEKRTVEGVASPFFRPPKPSQVLISLR